MRRMSVVAVVALSFLSPAALGAELPPLAPVPAFAAPAAATVTAGELRALVEEDWLKDIRPPLNTQSDARGACDGVLNGAYGFHTGQEPNPWWRVDLGEPVRLGRVVVYNRLDYAPGLHNADSLQVSISVDGENWTLVHDNGGAHFGGVSGAPPLELRFGADAPVARHLRLMIPSAAPIFFHLDEVEVYAAGDDQTNLARGKPADQSSMSIWSTAKTGGPAVYPTARHLTRGRALAERLRELGVDTAERLRRLDGAAARLAALSPAAPEEAARALYLDTRWIVRGLVLASPLLDFDRLLFVKRHTQETYPDICLNHMPWVSRPGGDLCVLEPLGDDGAPFSALAEPPADRPGQPVAVLRNLLNGALGPGHVHGMDLWFGGDRVVFGYARARSDAPPEGWLDRTQSYRLRREEEPIHLFELALENGALRQLTFGEWSDLDPTYAPNGDIVFVSERCGTSLQCNEYDKDETSCNLYVMRPDGGNIRRMSVNKDGDYLPHCLDNGMIAYTRWEYHERSWALIQSVWVVRPDGTGADALFKQHFDNPWAVEDARSIPGSTKLVAIAAGHHTLAAGPLIIVNHGLGVNEPRGIGIVSPHLLPPEGGMDGVPVPEGGTDDLGGFYSTPWALSEQAFLAAYSHSDVSTEHNGYGLYYVDVFGNKELLCRDPDISCFVPVPLRPRPYPPVLPDTTDPEIPYATCQVGNIGQGSEELPPGSIRYLRVAEPIGWPYDNEKGGHRYGEDHRYGGPDAAWQNLTNWTPVRILGDVPVNPDGSAQFRVPADTAVYFQLLDENRMELRRMRSFISFQPGEQRGCVGCHETRAGAQVMPDATAVAALRAEPSEMLPPPWGAERPVSFLRDVQPVLDAHCVRCHAGLKPDGGLDLSGGLLSHDAEIPGYGYNRAFHGILTGGHVSVSAARAQDASITPPLAYGARNSRLITALDDDDHRDAVKLSEDERLRLAMWIDANAPYHDRFVDKRPSKPAYDHAMDRELSAALRGIHERRCTPCHAPDEVTRTDWLDLERPEQSRFLTAPLAGAKGNKCGGTVYANRKDPDYSAARKLAEDAALRAWQSPRRDLAALEPPKWARSAGAGE